MLFSPTKAGFNDYNIKKKKNGPISIAHLMSIDDQRDQINSNLQANNNRKINRVFLFIVVSDSLE